MQIDQLLQDHAERQVRETAWFRSVPDRLKATLVVRVKGIEMRRGHSMMGDVASGPCLVADAECGEEERRFCWSFRLGGTNEVTA